MAEVREGSPEEQAYLAALVDAGHLVPSGVLGVLGRGATFEAIRSGLDRVVDEAVAATEPRPPETLRFPPILPREQLEKLEYLQSFPHLAGSLFSFAGSESDARGMQEAAGAHEDWSGWLQQSDLVMLPAACYPVYPAIARRGPLAAGGVTVDPGNAWVFRHEPSTDPSRLQMFHMRELVRIAEPETVQSWRDAWRDRALELLRSLGLDADFDVASDPFFGRGGRVMAASQKAQELKFEIQVVIAGPGPTAIASFNYHQDHFSHAYGLQMADGGEAHTACLGFGSERITLALLHEHGLDVGDWPDEVASRLGLR